MNKKKHPDPKAKNSNASALIAKNKRASFDFFIEKEYEGGLMLQGWEVKSLRAGKAQLTDSYVRIIRNEAWLIGCKINPLVTSSSHVNADETRSRKVLLHRKEIDLMRGLIEQKGYTLVAMQLYWRQGKCKLKVGIAKGKKLHDKRQAIKLRDWQRTEGRQLKKNL